MASTATEIERHDLFTVSGARIRELRQAKGYTQLKLSLVTGVTQCTISHLESGRQTRIRWATLQRLANGLGTTLGA